MDCQKPVFVGQRVHYVAYGTPGGEYQAGAHRLAFVTEITDQPAANLVVVNPTGLHFVFEKDHDELAQKPGSWHFLNEGPDAIPDCESGGNQ